MWRTVTVSLLSLALAFVTTAGVAGLAAAVAVSLAAATGATLVSAVEVG